MVYCDLVRASSPPTRILPFSYVFSTFEHALADEHAVPGQSLGGSTKSLMRAGGRWGLFFVVEDLLGAIRVFVERILLMAVCRTMRGLSCLMLSDELVPMAACSTMCFW